MIIDYSYTCSRTDYQNRMGPTGNNCLSSRLLSEIEDDLILKADKIIVDHVHQALNRGALKKLTGQGKLSEENIYTTFRSTGLKKATVGDLVP